MKQCYRASTAKSSPRSSASSDFTSGLSTCKTYLSTLLSSTSTVHPTPHRTRGTLRSFAFELSLSYTTHIREDTSQESKGDQMRERRSHHRTGVVLLQQTVDFVILVGFYSVLTSSCHSVSQIITTTMIIIIIILNSYTICSFRSTQTFV